MTAAVAPQPPAGVIATPTGRGQVTVTWQPPVDTGGVPLTQYAVRIDDKRVVVPPAVRPAPSCPASAGHRRSQVRAFNAVGHVGLGAGRGRRAGVPVGDGSDEGAQGLPGDPRRPGCCRGQPPTLRVTTVKSGRPGVTRTATKDGTGSAVRGALHGAGRRGQRRAALRGAPHRRTNAEALTRRPRPAGRGDMQPVLGGPSTARQAPRQANGEGGRAAVRSPPAAARRWAAGHWLRDAVGAARRPRPVPGRGRDAAPSGPGRAQRRRGR